MTDRNNDRDGQNGTPQPLAIEQTAEELARQVQVVQEGYIAQFADQNRPAAVRDTNVRRLLDELHPEVSLLAFRAIWESTTVFIAKLFSSADFTADNPGFINRHWILHGRAATDWTPADAVRLLNALNTLDWLMDVIERTRTRRVITASISSSDKIEIAGRT